MNKSAYTLLDPNSAVVSAFWLQLYIEIWESSKTSLRQKQKSIKEQKNEEEKQKFY